MERKKESWTSPLQVSPKRSLESGTKTIRCQIVCHDDRGILQMDPGQGVEGGDVDGRGKDVEGANEIRVSRQADTRVTRF